MFSPRRSVHLLALLALAVGAGACSDESSSDACDPACNADACEVCTADGTCASACAAGTVCEQGACVAVEAPTCTPACGPCQTCDTTGATPVCADNCGAELECQDGVCVAPIEITCAPACGPCEMCDTSGATPTCRSVCGDGATCDAASGACVGVSALHQQLGAPGGPLHGPFATPYAVTAACLGCHASAATEVMATAHWRWAGNTADLVAADGVTPVNPGTIGKANLINNFCVGVASNEKRCDQCHAGYGGDPDPLKPQKSARAYASADPGTGDSSIALAQRVDCLVCHADPTTGYAKDPKNFGLPATTVNLAVAAQNVRLPTRTNCGSCHFYAGGGDNVKLMGSSLKNPSEQIDVHMGRGMECLDCHASGGHRFAGAGTHVPTHTTRVACTTCHPAAPHDGVVPGIGAQLDTHTAKLACQTCHIPRFSRGQFGKVDWDWSTAGDNATCAGTPGNCVAGTVTVKVADDGVTPDPAATVGVVNYDFVKGNFRWQRNIKPAYRWSNGKSTHALTSDRFAIGARGTAADDASRIVLAEPVGSRADGKIMPYKLMRGRQAFYVDGGNSFTINPNVFGPGSLWGVLQAVGYSFATYDFDGAGPIAPGAPSVEALWGKILDVGARAASQTALTTPFARWSANSPAAPGFDWRYTKMYLDLNHEVAPKAQALGATGCQDCHTSGANAKLPMCELYPTAPRPWGVTCP
jgi:hypothetical protein